MTEETKTKIVLSKGQEPKEFTDVTERVLYWDEYRFKNAVYRQEQLTNDQALLIGEILLQLDFDGIRGLSDLTKINPFLILHTLIREKAIFKFLAIIMQRVDGNNLLETKEEEFRNSRSHTLKPFATEVFLDFFTLNSTLYSDIAEFVTVATTLWRDLKHDLYSTGKELMKSFSSRMEQQPKSKRSSKKGAAT